MRYLAMAIGISLAVVSASASPASNYVQVNLTSDLPGVAANLDLNLMNPWGLTASPTTPFWIADNGTGLSTIYPGSGTPAGLVVTVPPAPGNSPPSDPTGIVFNSGGASKFGGSSFIFVTEGGSIASWSGGPNATTAAVGDPGSVYKGVTLSTAGDKLYAANLGLGRVDVYDSNFNKITVPGGFQDPNLPPGYVPFNVQNIGGQIYVTFAKSSGGEDEIDGPGLGYVDVFDTNGVLQKRIASQGPLNAPWGLALAPATGFGAFSGDLLVGNFGDGLINAYDPNTGAFLGTLDDQNGKPISIDGLWSLEFGNGTQGTSVDSLYFTAGLNDESDGLFGRLDAVPERSAWSFTLVGFALMAAAMLGRRLKRGTVKRLF